MTRTIGFIFGIMLVVAVAWSKEPEPIDEIGQGLCAKGGDSVATVNYQDVRIKKFPFAMQCWSFRKFTFLETLQKVNELGIKYLQAYPGQRLAAETTTVKLNPKMNKKQIKTIRAIEQEFALAGTKFDHNLSDDQIQKIQTLLNAFGLTIVSYPKWLRWTAKLWLWVILATVLFLGLAVAVDYGPF